MFEDEDIGVLHTSSATHATTDHQRRLSYHLTASPHLSSSSFASPSSVPFVSKRRAVQFTNRSPDELEGDRIEADHDSDEDDIDFTQNNSHTHDQHAAYRPSSGDQPRGRHTRRHLTVERSPHCQPLERNVNKPFVCIFPYTLSGRRVDIPQQQEGGGEGAGDGGGGETNRCGQEFNTRQACENHIRSRHTFEKLRCSFPNCGFASTDVQNLNKHEKSHVRSNTMAMQPRAAEVGLRMRSL